MTTEQLNILVLMNQQIEFMNEAIDGIDSAIGVGDEVQSDAEERIKTTIEGEGGSVTVLIEKRFLRGLSLEMEAEAINLNDEFTAL